MKDNQVSKRIALSALQQRDFLTGTGRYLAELYAALPSARPADDFLLYVKHNQRDVFPADAPGRRHRLVEGCPASPPRRAIWEAMNFTRILRHDQIDLYHGPANFLPPRKVCPYIVTLHDMVYFHNPVRTFMLRAKYWQYYIRATWRLADLVLTVSEFSKKEIRRYLPVPANKIRVIYNGVDERFFHPVAGEIGAEMRREHSLDRPYILYVGRLDPDKNVERVVGAFHLLSINGNRDHVLVIAGARDFQASRVHELVVRLGLVDRVIFTGYVKDEHLVALYNQADAFCYPSLNEGFGLPVLEAMAAGTPVVTSNLSSLPEVAGDAGVQVEPRSAKAIARGLRSILGTARGRELAEAGRRRARQFTWQRAAEETSQAYDDVLRRK
jgi:glycosyltransferase involved in cell wall biosynthesis